MKRIVILLAGVLAVAAGAGAQIGKSVSVAAGTPEDRALSEIYAAPDGPEKIALLDKFMADYGQGDMALLGDQLYAQTYLAMKNYPKAYEYGDKALALDPDNLTTAVVLVHAADEQGDAKKVFDAGEKVAAILARYKASPAPEGASAEMWASQKQTTLANAQADIGYAEYAMVNAALKTTQPAARAAFLERFLTDFPDSSYATMVREQTAIAYQAAQNTPKMLAAAQNVLVANPNNISMLLLLSDNWSDKGEQLDKAADYARKALALLPKAAKPENVTDEQWQQQVALQKGIALSSLGEVYVNQNQNAPAVDSFKQASPLLKSNTVTYARNLYRLGFTLAKMQRTAEARTVLTEAVSINSPYRAQAQETLDKIGGAAGRKSGKKPPSQD